MIDLIGGCLLDSPFAKKNGALSVAWDGESGKLVQCYHHPGGGSSMYGGESGALGQCLLIVPSVQNILPAHFPEDCPYGWVVSGCASEALTHFRNGDYARFGQEVDKAWHATCLATPGLTGPVYVTYSTARVMGAYGGRVGPEGMVLVCPPHLRERVRRAVGD